MTLTVPQAGSEAGRAARLRVEGREDGNAIAAFGQQVKGVFEQVEQFELNSEFERAQVDATRELNDLRLEVDQIGDPRAAGEAWDQRSAAIKQRYLEGDEASPGLNQRNQERFGLAFDQAVNAHSFSLGRRFLQDRIAEREAMAIQAGQQFAREAVANRGESAEETFARGDAYYDAMVADGVIAADEAERRKLEMRQGSSSALLTDMLRQDPQELMQQLDVPGRFPGLAPTDIAIWKTKAQTAIDQELKFGASQANKETTDFLRVVRSEAMNGKDVHWDDLLSDPNIVGHDDFAQTEAVVLLAQERPDLLSMSPAQLSAEIERERQSAPGDERSARRLEALIEIRDQNVAGYEQDPIRQADRVDLPVPAFAAELDPANPRAFEQSIRSRLSFAEQMRAEGYTDGALRLFSDKEEAELKALAGTDQDPEVRAALARIAASAVAEDGSTPVLDLLGDPVLSHVGGLLSAGGREDLGREILQGQSAIDLGNALVPPASERLEEAQAAIGDVLVDLPGEELLQQEINQSIDALFAARMKREDPTGEMNAKVYAQAAHEVLGGTGQYGRADARGGIQDFKGAATIIPMGLSAEKLETNFTMLGTDGEGASYAAAYRSFTEERFQEHLRQIAGDSLPVIAGRPITRDELVDGQVSIKAIGDDVYILQVDTDTGLKTIQSDAGGDYQFSLRLLNRIFGP
ncbi:hypothetical protein [Pseudooceanicola sp. 200-1SW]|uniref:hypothetical protein n=1 Tax=Pseudooceanicola sp. 200-1SW TaxID=3425949 RepID=UPI003D7FD253